MMTQADVNWMEAALTEADRAAVRGEVPVGALILLPESAPKAFISEGNRIIERRDPTAHAELLVIREAARVLNNERLTGCTLYSTLEPCAMCAGAIAMARIPRIVFAASDPKGGAVRHGPRFFEQPTCHHRPEVIVLENEQAQRSAELLREFFRSRR